MNKSRMREPFHTLIYKASMGYNDSWSNVDQEVLEKFAELIIQECIDIVLDSDPSPKMSVREPYGSIMENIKEHFGWHDE